MHATLFDLTDRNAVVTGAGRGLGKAIALGLARQGADVAVVDCALESAEETAAEVRSLGRRSVALRCNVAQEADVHAMVRAVRDQLGPVDVLVNNAGITKRIPLFEWQPADWEEVIRVNQIGTFLVAREVGRQMLERKRGSIVNVAALGGAMVGLGRGNAIYCGTKGAVLAMTRELAAEWARHGVRVNAIAPGWFKTDMNTPLLKNGPVVQRILERVPLGRLGEPADAVGPVVFLASDAAAMLTGCLLPVDGGVHAIVTLSQEAVIR